MLQQYLPFTVLKPQLCATRKALVSWVATVLTVYGIETCHSELHHSTQHYVATVLTVYGIETCKINTT